MMFPLYLSLIENEEDRDKVIYLYKKYYSYMRYCAAKILEGDSSEAEDAVHDAIVSIIDNLHVLDFSDEAKVKSLCGIVARNRAIDYYRKNNKRLIPVAEIFYDHEQELDDPESIVIHEDTYRVILNAINRLDDTYRDVCLLKYVNELSEREIAQILNLSEKAVSLRIFRGKQILRESLRKENCHV